MQQSSTDSALYEQDADCVQRIANGDSRATRQLVEQHLPAIVRFAQKMLGNQHDAEDVAQEVFLRLWRVAPTWKPHARVRTWLLTVAHNQSIDRLRARRPTREVAPEDLTADTQIDKLNTSEIRAAFDALTDQQRAALALVYYEELSNREAADVLNLSVDAVESLLRRARQNLRRQINQEEQTVRSEPSP